MTEQEPNEQFPASNDAQSLNNAVPSTTPEETAQNNFFAGNTPEAHSDYVQGTPEQVGYVPTSGQAYEQPVQQATSEYTQNQTEQPAQFAQQPQYEQTQFSQAQPGQQYVQDPNMQNTYDPNGQYVPYGSYGQQVPPQQVPPQAAYMPPVAYNANGQPMMVGDKSKVVAAVLAFFLGAFGVHNFYLGKTTRAVAQLLMGTVGWILIIPPFISGIWAFVEFILILVAAPGTPYHEDGQGFELCD